jgi:hypothetical protein
MKCSSEALKPGRTEPNQAVQDHTVQKENTMQHKTITIQVREKTEPSEL